MMVMKLHQPKYIYTCEYCTVHRCDENKTDYRNNNDISDDIETAACRFAHINDIENYNIEQKIYKQFKCYYY